MNRFRRFLPILIALVVGLAVFFAAPSASASDLLKEVQSLTLEQVMHKLSDFLEVARVVIAGLTTLGTAGIAAWYSLRKDVQAQRQQLDVHSAVLSAVAPATVARFTPPTDPAPAPAPIAPAEPTPPAPPAA